METIEVAKATRTALMAGRSATPSPPLNAAGGEFCARAAAWLGPRLDKWA